MNLPTSERPLPASPTMSTGRSLSVAIDHWSAADHPLVDPVSASMGALPASSRRRDTTSRRRPADRLERRSGHLDRALERQAVDRRAAM